MVSKGPCPSGALLVYKDLVWRAKQGSSGKFVGNEISIIFLLTLILSFLMRKVTEVTMDMAANMVKAITCRS